MFRSALYSFLLSFLPAVALIGFGGYFYADAEIRYEERQLQVVDQETVQLATQALRHSLHGITSSIEFLANLPDLRSSVNRSTPASLALVAANIAVYMNSHGAYDQVRWIDQTGRERLRLNFVDGQARRVPEEALQDKSRRPYFLRASKLPRGAIYVSPFDLNIEREQVEVPHKPVIRFATPLFDDRGHRRGILVLNYLGQTLLDRFVQAAGSGAERLMLLNRQGYWLRGQNQVDEWGFMLDKATTLADRNPRAWALVKDLDHGHATLADGLWTWASVVPVAEVHAVSSWTAEKLPSIYGRSWDNRRYEWRAVMQTPAQTLTALSERVWQVTGPIMGLLALLAAAMSLWVARSQWRIKRLNLELSERAQSAEVASRAKADFLANMSHEIRTPMNAILGLAHVLEQARLPDDASDLVRKIRSAGRTLLGIINDILDFSKIEAGRLELEQVPFRLGDVLDNLSTIMSTNAGNKDIELIIAPPPAGIDQLCGDALRLEQILINLTSNAIKFTDSGYVEVTITTLAADDKQIALQFSVRDSGIGISEEHRQEIFAPFSQADASTTRRFGGTGLGLAICRRLVAQMKGEMSVTSILGKGSEFRFSLTFGRVATTQFSQPAMAHLDVLIADDSPIAREALRRTAVSLGWKATTVSGGESAVQRVLAQHVKRGAREVLVLDWKMPGMDGLHAARTIHEALKGDHEPIVIMVTAHSRDDLLASPDGHLADAVLNKPVTASMLYDAVAKAYRAHDGDNAVAFSTRRGGQRLAGLRILVVDDSDINREVAQHIFTDEGAAVSSANDGREAVDWLLAHPGQVDIVLMDVQMPVMDGYEATRLIRRTPALAGLPVVALTAGVFKEQQEAALAAGMSEFIAKPFDVDAAIALIRELTGWKDSPVASQPEPSQPEPAVAPAAELVADLPGLAVERGLALWRNADVYRQYLRKFACDYGDGVRQMAQAERAAAAALAHKLKGAAANLALDEVAALAGEADRVLPAGEDAAAILTRLQAALDTALASIAQYASRDGVSLSSDSATLNTLNLRQIAPLLARAMDALNADNPDTIEPLLDKLGRWLPADRLAPLREAIENFDFRGGERATHALATELGIALEVSDHA